jgi:hypothetical protein
VKNHGYSVNYERVMNLAHAMMTGLGFESVLSERRAQDVKNKARNANEQTEYTPQQFYDCAICELAIRAFDIQSGCRNAFKRRREYTRRNIFMGKLNPEKISQRLQDMNKYLDLIPIERNAGADKTQKAYGKSFPDDGVRYIMG